MKLNHGDAMGVAAEGRGRWGREGREGIPLNYFLSAL